MCVFDDTIDCKCYFCYRSFYCSNAVFRISTNALRIWGLCILLILVYHVVLIAVSLDMIAPGEEKSLHSKMLLKLRGTFKVRLFQGSDWPESNKISSSGESYGNTNGE